MLEDKVQELNAALEEARRDLKHEQATRKILEEALEKRPVPVWK